MSADNWAICPQCVKSNMDKHNKIIETVKQTLGDDAMLDVIQVIEFNKEKFRTLREDYELGIFENGEFFIRYRGHCLTCGLSKNYDHKEQLVEVAD